MRTIAALLLLAACGGAQKSSPPPAGAKTAEPAASEPAGPSMSESYASLNAYFRRQQPLVSQCYASAVEQGQIKGTEVGYVTVGMVVPPSGKPQKVHVARTSLRAPAVEDCIVKMVRGWVLPAPAEPLDFMFAYEFRP